MKVGFIGVGNVGGKLSGSLLRNGIDLTVHDLNAALVADFVKRGAKAAESPAQLMRDCSRSALPIQTLQQSAVAFESPTPPTS